MADQIGNNKAVAAALSGALVVILSWVAQTFVNTPIPSEVVAAAQTVFTCICVWLIPHGGDT